MENLAGVYDNFFKVGLCRKGRQLWFWPHGSDPPGFRCKDIFQWAAKSLQFFN